MKPSPTQRTSPGSKLGWWAAGAALAAIGVALWPHAHPSADRPAAGAQAGSQASAPPSPFTRAVHVAQAPATTGAPPPAKPGASGPVSAAATAAASRPPLPPVEAPADSLRKVQLALGGGTPEEALAAALTLESCRHAASVAESMHRGRQELSPAVPPEIKKALDKMAPPPATLEQLDRADQEQRRCQVFDAAMLSRSGELMRRAYEGGAQGAAISYLLWLQTDGKDQATPALIATLQAQVRASVEAGDFAAVAAAAYGPASTLAVTPVQVQAYREAWLRIGDELGMSGAAQTKNVFAAFDEMGHVQPLTPAQQRDADALAQQIVEAWRKRQHKGG